MSSHLMMTLFHLRGIVIRAADPVQNRSVAVNISPISLGTAVDPALVHRPRTML
jgi:hypothetical protein